MNAQAMVFPASEAAHATPGFPEAKARTIPQPGDAGAVEYDSWAAGVIEYDSWSRNFQ